MHITYSPTTSATNKTIVRNNFMSDSHKYIICTPSWSAVKLKLLNFASWFNAREYFSLQRC